MATLTSEPPRPIRSLRELMALAAAMERQAADHYEALAERLRLRGIDDLAGLFAGLAQQERQHVRSVEHWSTRRLGHAPEPADLPWAPAGMFDHMAEELAQSLIASPYRILSMAVRNEERAFLAWTHIAATAAADDVRSAAERMAHEELEHVAILRRARRSAYRAERAIRPATAPRTTGWLLAEAAQGEAALAAALFAMANGLRGDQPGEALRLAHEARDLAAELADMTADIAPPVDARAIAALAERLVEAYLDIGDRSRDEAVVTRIQAVTLLAIRRLAWIRGVTLGDGGPTPSAQ